VAARPISASSITKVGSFFTDRITKLLLFVLTRDWAIIRLLRQSAWNLLYTQGTRRVFDNVVEFMNLGYVDPSATATDLGGHANISDYLAARLYEKITKDVELSGRMVVDVGCGRGGGSAYVARVHRPASMLGVDINRKLIAVCNRNYHMENLGFIVGDAQALPLEADSVDVVLNVESSHCYRSRFRFFEQVRRVLRPGGSFLFADFVDSESAEEADGLTNLLESAGMAIQSRAEITDGILGARDVVSQASAFQRHVRERIPQLEIPIFRQFFCFPGTWVYEQLASGRIQYWQWHAVKPRG
jgi:ubiquinone/menaquinone biosynthesis C-methylase UbiE